MVISIVVITLITLAIAGPLIIIYQYQQIKYPYRLENAFPNLSFNRPLGLYSPNYGSDRIFVVEQTGRIYVFNNSATVLQKKVFLDLSLNITYKGEMGLLGLAFHPNYTTNGKFYVNYNDLMENTIIAQFTVNNTDINRANYSSGLIILEQSQPFANHNGGQIAFGPDGYLYIGFGDGGGSGDPQNNAQNIQNILGSIIRIDVDSSFPYSIPSDNPFFGNPHGYKEEIWAYGFRNPWRFSFDLETGNLWVADVGQNKYEEIDIVQNGSNYGWNVMEGSSCYDGGSCDQTNLILPIFEYEHPIGESITGGFVYRGTKLKNLTGEYIYGDFITGKIWALSYDQMGGSESRILLDSTKLITSFGIDDSNELYICTFDKGHIYKLIES